MTQTISDPSSTFRQETASVLARLRSSFSRVLIDYRADGTLRGRDLQKRLGLDARLSWQIARIVNVDDPLELSPHVPSSALVSRVLSAAQKNGSSPDAISAVQDAYSAFEQHVETYAGDRNSFDMIMARLLGGETDAQLEMAHRRAIFEGHRYLRGFELDAFSAAWILHPSATIPGGFDSAVVRIKHGLLRFDPRIPIQVEARRLLAEEPGKGPGKTLPLDQEAYAKYGIPILPEFCSQRELPLTSTPLADGISTICWNAETFGRNSAVTVAFGNLERGFECEQRANNQLGYTLHIPFVTPTRTAVQDMILHRSTFGGATCNVTRWASVGKLLEYVRVAAVSLPEMPCSERVRFIGEGIEATHLPEIPRYTDLLRYACTSAGWDLNDFDVYRIRMEYPVMDTMIKCEYTFPDYKAPL